MATLDEVRAQAFALSTEERGALSEELAASVFEPAALEWWMAEVERRRARIDAGQDSRLTADDFFRDE